MCTYSWSLIAACAGGYLCVRGRGIKALAPQKHQLIVHFSDNKHKRTLAKSLLFQASGSGGPKICPKAQPTYVTKSLTFPKGAPGN